MSESAVDQTFTFAQKHRPNLRDGDYRLEVTQSVAIGDASQNIPTHIQPFTIAGERYALDKGAIHAFFPASGSVGGFSGVLPHVVLNRSTLPWERTAEKSTEADKDTDTPWLMLLLFDQTEEIKKSTTTWSELLNGPRKLDGVSIPYSLQSEVGEQDDDPVNVIDIPQPVFDLFFGNIDQLRQELSLLAHVRENEEEEKAIIVGSRLPRAGSASEVHLVSVEHLLENPSDDALQGEDTDYVRLISLASWSFSTEEQGHDFSGLLQNMDVNTLQYPSSQLKSASGASTASELSGKLQSGKLFLPHALRNGSAAASWYSSPLAPGPSENSPQLPAFGADSLLTYDEAFGVLDTTYAAAWELGRLLALQSKSMSVALYHWKLTYAQQQHQQAQQGQYSYLPFQKEKVDIPMPTQVYNWFQDLLCLKPIPFSYLVPDEALLPNEAIRFFTLDKAWMACLVDGAFSLGRQDQEQDTTLKAQLPPLPETVTGFIMRSDFVAGWPDTNITAEIAGAEQAPLWRKLLSQRVLLCLFAGDIATVTFHHKPERLHFGVEVSKDASGQVQRRKKLREWTTGEMGETIIEVPMLPSNKVNIKSLADAMGQGIQSDRLAFQMIEGAPQVTFTKGLKSQ